MARQAASTPLLDYMDMMIGQEDPNHQPIGMGTTPFAMNHQLLHPNVFGVPQTGFQDIPTEDRQNNRLGNDVAMMGGGQHQPGPSLTPSVGGQMSQWNPANQTPRGGLQLGDNRGPRPAPQDIASQLSSMNALRQGAWTGQHGDKVPGDPTVVQALPATHPQNTVPFYGGPQGGQVNQGPGPQHMLQQFMDMQNGGQFGGQAKGGMDKNNQNKRQGNRQRGTPKHGGRR